METAPLKSFATWARTALIREVNARIVAVLAPASKDRVESASAVAALERDIAAEGGGETGGDAVADKVAYTWFNRIIALRFMDANGYTGIGVVSPPRGQTTGQPEVLADAKRGNIDPAVVMDKRGIETITALLDGTRRSDDPQGEAYALLLAEYCRHWNRSMPFMFEHEGDYTELLIPANMLADDSVVARAATVLTEDVCRDVEVIGWLYQFYISERKDEVFAGFKKNKKAGAAEIPAATQLFTPHWIVRYLVENSVGQLWLLNRPNSRLANQMEYYIKPVGEKTDFLKVSSPEELKLIDPACGSGHMLTYAFDLLYAIYEEEGYAPADIPCLILTHNLYGTEIDPRAGTLAAFALAMKARDRQRTFFTKGVQPNICVLDPISFSPDELELLVTRSGDRVDEETFWNSFEHADTFGALIKPHEAMIEPLRRYLDDHPPADGDLLAGPVFERARKVLTQAEFLSPRYGSVVANPPYMGSNNMGSLLSNWLVENYPVSKSDLLTAFMERAESLSVGGGLWGMINLPSWPFLTSFEELRRKLLGSSTIESFLHLGRGVFGSDFGSVAFVVSRSPAGPSHVGTYRRLFDQHVDVRPVEKIRQLFLDNSYGHFEANQSRFFDVPGIPFAYWLSDVFHDAFRRFPQLSKLAAPKQGLATANDGKFLRLWHEVSTGRIGLGVVSRLVAEESGRKWFPFNKGGAFRRWFGNIEHVVNWANDGQEIRTDVGDSGRVKARPQNLAYYFDVAVTWSNVSSGAPAFRVVDRGVIFGHVGQSLFGTETVTTASLAILNSTFGAKILEVLAPTIHYEVGSIAKVPVQLALDTVHVELVNRLVAIARDDWNAQETSIGFAYPGWISAERHGTVREALDSDLSRWSALTSGTQSMEVALNAVVAEAYGLQSEISTDVPLDRVSLTNNPYFRFENVRDAADARERFLASGVLDLVSYAVGCIFGRYSLDEPGLMLADQGDTLREYMDKVPAPSFTPNKDNVIPIVDGDWFEDDIVARFRQFLRVAFGEEHFEENLRFVTESLGVKDLRDYFVKSFYLDHVKRYKRRPIYWLFSSPKGSFSALIYMQRYTPSTVSTVLNEYLREFKAKLEASRQHQERLTLAMGTPREKAAAEKEVDRLRKVLLELDEYEHDVLYPLATQQLAIDLDDGVKANYPKFGTALKKIPGLEGDS